MKKKTLVLCLLSLFIFSSFGQAQETVSTPPSSKPSAPASIKPESIDRQVEILREQRFKQMPYLDKGYIRSSIRPDNLRQKQQFAGGLTPKDLDKMIERAIQVHTPARVARERISLARRRILVALRALFPEAALKLQDKEGQLSDRDYNSQSYRFTFRQPVFRGGVLWNTLLQEKASLEAAEKEYDSVIEDLVNDVSAAYLEYNRSEEVVRSQNEIIEEMDRYVKISKQKYKAEIISEIEHLNTQSLFSQLQYDFETSKQELELAKLDLQRFLDLGIEDDVHVVTLYDLKTLLAEGKTTTDGEAPEIEALEGNKKLPELDDLVDLAYQHRSALHVEASKLESARLEERVRWGEMIPHADVVLEFGKLGEAFNDVSTNPGLRTEFRLAFEMNWNAAGNKMNLTYEDDQRAPSVTQFEAGSGSRSKGPSFTVGLLDGLDKLVEIKEAEVAKLEQVIQLEKKEKEVIHDVKQAFFDYQKAKIRVQSSLQRVDYRERLAALNKHRLDKNEIQISEYLQAQIDLSQEMATLHKALADFYTAKAKLNHAIGIRNYFAIEEKRGSQTA